MISKPLSDLSQEELYRVISICAALPDVRQEVIKNHDDNRWWPLSVKDIRLRLVIAGWSTRISYSMIGTYQSVVASVNAIGFDALSRMTDTELIPLLTPLGLIQTRLEYFRSVVELLNDEVFDVARLQARDNDELIRVFASRVRGASFKVAQCAILYAKGYHCGIFPVDSGMKDMLGPCMGIDLPSGPESHEVMRKVIENLLHSSPERYRVLAVRLGYDQLSLPQDGAPVWWAHLVLIYFKRSYCNRHVPHKCPLRMSSATVSRIGAMCDRSDPRCGGTANIVLEGLDRSGKSTLAAQLSRYGYSIRHAPYVSDHVSIEQHYRDLIDGVSTSTVFDRTFISEMVYGPVLRRLSRIPYEVCIELFQTLKEKGFVIIYVREDLEEVRRRLYLSYSEHATIIEALTELDEAYTKTMNIASEFVPTITIRPSTVGTERLDERIRAELRRYYAAHSREMLQ